MKTHAMNHTELLTTRPAHSSNGCLKDADTNTVKMQLQRGLGLPVKDFSRQALSLLQDEKQPLNDRIFAMQGLARVKAAEAEEPLLNIVAKNDVRLSYTALRSLSLTGTERSFKALAATKELPFKSLERQKDFTMLLIGYRLQLPDTDKILDRLLKDANDAPKRKQEFP